MEKKRKNAVNMGQNDGGDATSDSSEDDEDMDVNPDVYTGNEQVEVDFEGRAPHDPDFHGMFQLLSRLFLKAHINCKEMAELIISQNYVGSVICQSEADENDSDDDDLCEDGTIFGITTVLNMTKKKANACIEELRSYIMERAEKHAKDSVLTHIRDVLGNETRHVGFLVNERFINIPAEISVPLLENLVKEMEEACRKSMKFEFEYFLMIVKLYRKEPVKGKAAEDFYTNQEEEIFCSHAVNTFEYSVADECDTGIGGNWLEDDPTLIPYRKVLLLDGKELPQIILDIKKMLSGE